jgi:hypothetical protein
MVIIVKCKCGRNTTFGVLCGFCSKNYSPRDSRPLGEIDEYDEEFLENEEEYEDIEEDELA